MICFRKFKPVLAVAFFCLVLISGLNSQSIKVVDMSEEFLKIQQSVMFYDLGDDGFAAYDIGDGSLKVFSWDCTLKQRIPIKKGEGPGELKSSIASVCLVDGKFYIAGFFENKICIFNRNGKFEKDLKVDFSAKEIFFHHDKLYLLKLNLLKDNNGICLGKFADPVSGKASQDICLKGEKVTADSIGVNSFMARMSSTFEVSKNGNIHLLVSSASLLVTIDRQFKVIRKITLPYKERILSRTIKNGDEDQSVMSVLDWYPDVRAFEDDLYICFSKTVKRDPETGKGDIHTIVIKVDPAGKTSEKEIEGDQIIIGRNKGVLYLFNTEEYVLSMVKTSDWKTRK